MNSIIKDDIILLNLKGKINLNKVINTDWIIETLKSKGFISINGLDIEQKEPFFIIKNKILKFNFPENLNINILTKYSDVIYNIKKKENFILNDYNNLLKYIYLEVILYIELLIESEKNKDIKNFNKYLKKIKELIDKDTKIYSFNFKNNFLDNKNWTRKSLIEKNKNSLEWNTDNKFVINMEISMLLQKINAKTVEVPFNYDKKNLIIGLKYINNLLNNLEIKKRDFQLRFKKLKLYKKEGMFFKNINTIIVDPRNINAFKHELGHYLYENGISFTLKNKRIYNSNFENIIKKASKEKKYQELKKHDLEDYDLKSEIFAYWFENQ